MTPTLRHLDPAIHSRRRADLLRRLGGPVAVFGMGGALGAGSKSHGALRYLTGWDGHESAALLVLTPQRSRLILSSPFMVPVALEMVPELAPVHGPATAWPDLLQEVLPVGQIGLVGMDELPTGIAQSLGPMIRDDRVAQHHLDQMRLIKEPAALAMHREGAAICDAMFAHLPTVLRPGRPVVEAQRALEALALSRGADHCRTWLTVRSEADRPRYWPEENLAPVSAGDQVLLGIALTVDGHWAHGIRMGAVGEVRPEHARLMELVAGCLHAGLAKARRGVAVSDLAGAMERAFVAGTRDMDLSGAQRFRFGHGLGLSYEDPILTDAFVQTFGTTRPSRPAETAGGKLAPGMVLELHPNLFLPGLGGAALGEMVIITDSGPECALRTPLAPIRV
ncbi:MAG: M24 family metallopeptidase [Rhodobacterales bacterium]|nr:M24 family metallopeptidase [Rhodobacterales bacterium]MDX5412751.1 M24 family metallopeptidase [Rhodobacterales bacterium]